MRILERIVGVQRTEQSAGIIVGDFWHPHHFIKSKKRIWNPFWKPYPSFYVKRIFAIRFAIWLKCCISCIIGSISSIPHIRLAVFCYKKAEIRYFFAFLCTIIIIEMNHIPQNPGRTHDCLPLCRSGGLLRLNDSLQLEMPTYIYLAVFISSHYFRIRAWFGHHARVPFSFFR